MLSTAGRIVKAVKEAGKPIGAREIGIAEVFDTDHTVYNGLAQIMKMEPCPLVRLGVTGKYTYIVNEGTDLEDLLDDDNDDDPGITAIRPERADTNKGFVAPRLVPARPAAPTPAPAPIVAPKIEPKVEAPMPQPVQQAKKPEVKLDGTPWLMTGGPNADLVEDDPKDVRIEPCLIALVLKLPTIDDDGMSRWDKDSRRDWINAFHAVADMLFPESK